MSDNAEKKVELKSCPFCGDIPELITRGNAHTKKRSAEVLCHGCNTLMVVGAIRYSLEWCVDIVTSRWNTRKD